MILRDSSWFNMNVNFGRIFCDKIENGVMCFDSILLGVLYR